MGALGGGALALFAGVRLGPGGLLPIAGDASSALAARPRPFRRRLPIPRELTGSDIRIPVRPAKVPILPGRRTNMWTYGGTFPGPTIRRRAGELTRVTFDHKLPKRAGELTVHLHGGHNRASEDGQPGGQTRSLRKAFYCKVPAGLSDKAQGNNLLIRPGGRRTYKWDLIEGAHDPSGHERAATQWYHDHRLERTSENVWKGLAGFFIIDDDFEDALPLPKGKRDIPLMITDRTFDGQNQLTDPFGKRPPFDGVVGRRVLVNGAFKPFCEVAPMRYRLRILNASHFRPYNVYLSNGATLTQVGTDSGLMPKPVRRKRILLGPAERAEVIVDFSGAKGKRVELRSGPRSDGRKALGERPYRGSLMQFRVGASAPGPDETMVPQTLRPLPEWARKAKKRADRTWTISIGGGFDPSWLINGKTFNPGRVDARPKLGTTETWRFRNKTAVAHIIHLHHTDWYMLERNGKPPKPWEDCLKESFILGPNETILLAGHFSDFKGKYVIHCHMLDHEDHGLMAQFEVVG